MGAGGGFRPPQSKEERRAFALNPEVANAQLGIGNSLNDTGTRQAGTPAAAPASSRRKPQSLLGGAAPSNAQSTGRSLIKDPVSAGSLLR